MDRNNYTHDDEILENEDKTLTLSNSVKAATVTVLSQTLCYHSYTNLVRLSDDQIQNKTTSNRERDRRIHFHKVKI